MERKRKANQRGPPLARGRQGETAWRVRGEFMGKRSRSSRGTRSLLLGGRRFRNSRRRGGRSIEFVLGSGDRSFAALIWMVQLGTRFPFLDSFYFWAGRGSLGKRISAAAVEGRKGGRRRRGRGRWGRGGLGGTKQGETGSREGEGDPWDRGEGYVTPILFLLDSWEGEEGRHCKGVKAKQKKEEEKKKCQKIKIKRKRKRKKKKKKKKKEK